jgi:hypothetical protein
LKAVESKPAAFASPEGVSLAFQAMVSMAFQTLWWLFMPHSTYDSKGQKPASTKVNAGFPGSE